MVFVAARGSFGLDLSLSPFFFLSSSTSFFLSFHCSALSFSPSPFAVPFMFSLGMLVPPPVVNDGCFWSWLNGEVWCWLLFVVENGGLFVVHWVLCFGSTASPAGWWRLPVGGGLETRRCCWWAAGGGSALGLRRFGLCCVGVLFS